MKGRTIIQQGKNGYKTIRFMRNNIFYMQDHGFWKGIPHDIDFVIDKASKDGIKLIAPGFGALKDNPYGLPYNYGNGAIYVKISELIDSILPNEKSRPDTDQ